MRLGWLVQVVSKKGEVPLERLLVLMGSQMGRERSSQASTTTLMLLFPVILKPNWPTRTPKAGLAVEAINESGDVVKFGKDEEKTHPPKHDTGLLSLGENQSRKK